VSKNSEWKTAERLTSLDGLRGLASLVVLFWHCSLVSTQLLNLDPASPFGSFRWWVALSPFRLLSAGPEAVLIFFVLSGMVVALPVLRQPNFDWIAYYPRRILRLYLPIFAAIIFAAACILANPQILGAQINYWIKGSSVPQLSVNLFVQSLDIFAPGNLLDNPIWSLRWEFIFSLALPIFVAAAVITRKHWKWGLAVAFGLVWLGYFTNTLFLMYLPMFYAGGLLAVHHGLVRGWAAGTTRGRLAPHAIWFLVLVSGCTLLIANRMLLPLIAGHAALMAMAMAMSFFGAVLLVTVSFLWRPAIKALSLAPMRWLGRISFSLYLVHVPVLTFFANVFGPGHSLAIVASTIPTALLVAELFARFIEGPAHRLATHVGTSTATRFRTAPAEPTNITSPALEP
jgi:peptidoglycan/LPS O-acetylase OafA/YrhL